MEAVCAHCGRPGESLRRCTGCWTVRYCSPACQRRHWPSHKGACGKRPVRSPPGPGTEREKDKLKGEKTKPSSAQDSAAANRRKGGKEEDGVSSASQEAAPVHVCKTCKTTSSTAVKCTRCQEVTYCSRDCRRADWLTHMDTCVPVHPTKEVHGKTEHAVSEGDEGVESSSPHDHPAEASGAKQTGEKDCPTSRPDLTAEEEDDDEDVKTCQKCKTRTKSMKRCGRCLDVTYCSRDCQSADWSTHKVTCQPIEVLTTEGYRETLRKEEAARQETANRLANLLFHSRLFTGAPEALGWQEARSRASRLFPLQRIVDDFERLDSDFMGLPFRLFPSWMEEGRGAGVVALGRLTTPYFHPFRPARGVEDMNGMSVYVIFYTGEPPWPYFQYSQLREGNYICIQEAFLHLFADGSVGFRIEDVSDVRIIESTP